jgi:hypothetical protein
MHAPSSPAWSIPGRNKSRQESDIPGPGAYDPRSSIHESQPSVKIGTSTRDDTSPKATAIPGPGSYDPDISKMNSAPK